MSFLLDKSSWIIYASLVVLLFVVSKSNYLVFHISVEFFSILIAFSIFLLIWNARKIMKSDFFLFLSLAFLAVGIIGFLHTLAYKGMGIFPGVDSNLPTQFWIAGRYLFALSLLISPVFLFKKHNPLITFFVYLGAVLFIISTTLHFNIFPDSYIEGSGLTSFKIVSEYIISIILVMAAFYIYKYKEKFDPKVYKYLMTSLILSIVSELIFTLYFNVFGLFNFLGHVGVMFSYYFMYKAVIEVGLTNPYKLLFLELSKSDQRKQDFISQAGHELKTPVAGMKLAAEILERKLSGSKDLDKIELTQIIDQQVDSLNLMVNNLLDLARSEIDSINFSFEKLKLEDFAQKVIEELKPMAPKHYLKIEVSDNIYVKADKERLKQVMTNLIINAVKFSPEGKEIIIRIGNGGNMATVSIQDFGKGITTDKLTLIFEKYFKANSRSGLGLGLYISKIIIEKHGGKIWAESEQGKGSTFYFSLPVMGH